MDRMPLSTIYEHIERAIKVAREMILDRQYVVRDGEIVIVDEFTGRLGEGRKWRAGIHQAVEAKEGVKITFATGRRRGSRCRTFFLRYDRLAGMTGTAAIERRRAAQDLHAASFPCPRTGRRFARSCKRWCSARRDDKWQAIIDDIAEQHQAGRPVLVGTRSIDKSERLAQMLIERGIEHCVLNAACTWRRSGDRREGRPAGQSHRGHEHGRPRHRHSPRRGCA